MSVIHNIITNVAPSAAPDRVGQHWTNTVTKISYISVGTSVVGDWIDITTPSGGGGIDPSYQYSSAMTYTDTNGASHNAWKDVTGASLAITPSGSEKHEIQAEFHIASFTTALPVDPSRVYARVVDSLDNLIDNAQAYFVRTETVTNSMATKIWPMKLFAKVTINSAKTYKIQIRQNNGGGITDHRAAFIVTDSFDNSSLPAKFFSKRVY